MPQVIVSTLAQRDLQRLQNFLKNKNRLAARKAGEVIVRAIQQLKTQPEMGRPVPFLSLKYQELVIGFGDSGYVSLYRFDGETAVVLAVRHQREDDYH